MEFSEFAKANDMIQEKNQRITTLQGTLREVIEYLRADHEDCAVCRFDLCSLGNKLVEWESLLQEKP